MKKLAAIAAPGLTVDAGPAAAREKSHIGAKASDPAAAGANATRR